MRRWLIAGLILDLGLAISSVALLTNPRQRGDFTQLYTAWTMVRAGEGPRLYDYGLQAVRQREVLKGQPFPGGLLPFNYPPHVALVFAWLPALSLPAAFLLWSAGQGLLVLWLLRVLARLTRGQPGLERWLTCAAVLATPALLLTFVQGAFSLLLLLAVLKLYEALVAGRERSAGLWLALGTFKPQLVLGPALVPLAARRWRVVGAFAAAMLAVVVACALAFGPRTWIDFLSAVLKASQTFESGGIHVASTINLKGALVFAFGPGIERAAGLISVGTWLLACAGTLWLWRGPWRPDEPRFALRFAFTILLGTFFTLHLYQQDGLMIAAAAVLFDSYLRRAGRPRAGMAVIAALAPLLWLLTELVLTPRWLRVPVLLQLVLGLWMARELRLPSNLPRVSGGGSPKTA